MDGSSILLSLATALARKAGAAVFQENFGHTYLYQKTIASDEVDISKASIAKIVEGVREVVRADVSEELMSHVIHKAQSRLTNIQDYFANQYPHLGGTNERKDSEIIHYERTLTLDVLGPLQHMESFNHRLVALPAWILAASLHMAILQERANLLPEEEGRKKLLAIHARKYADYAESTYREGLRLRLGQISKLEKSSRLLHKISFIGVSRFHDKAFSNGMEPFDLTADGDKVLQHAEYRVVVQTQLEWSLSRPATLEVFKVWSQEYPGCLTFSPMILDKAEPLPVKYRNEQFKECFFLHGVKARLSCDYGPMKLKGEYQFSLRTDTGRFPIHLCESEGALCFESFVVPANLGDIVKLDYWASRSKKWVKLAKGFLHSSHLDGKKKKSLKSGDKVSGSWWDVNHSIDSCVDLRLGESERKDMEENIVYDKEDRTYSRFDFRLDFIMQAYWSPVIKSEKD